MQDVIEWFEVMWADITKAAPDTSRFDSTPVPTETLWGIELRPDVVKAGGRYRWCGFVATPRGMVWISEMTRRRAREAVNQNWSPIL